MLVLLTWFEVISLIVAQEVLGVSARIQSVSLHEMDALVETEGPF